MHSIFKEAAKLAKSRMSQYYEDVFEPKIKGLEDRAIRNYAYAESSLDKPIENTNKAVANVRLIPFLQPILLPIKDDALPFQEKRRISAREATIPDIISKGKAQAADILHAAKAKASQMIASAEEQAPPQSASPASAHVCAHVCTHVRTRVYTNMSTHMYLPASFCESSGGENWGDSKSHVCSKNAHVYS